MTASEIMQLLRLYRDDMTRQQLRTIKGQALSGDTDGALKGIERIINKNRKEE